MALAYSTRPTELQFLTEQLSAIESVRQAFVQTTQDSLVALIVLDEYDAETERRLVDIEGKLIDACPWLDIDFDVLFLGDRQLSDVVSPKGTLLFAR